MSERPHDFDCGQIHVHVAGPWREAGGRTAVTCCSGSCWCQAEATREPEPRTVDPALYQLLLGWSRDLDEQEHAEDELFANDEDWAAAISVWLSARGVTVGAATFEGFSARNLRRCEAPDGFNHALHSWSLSDWFTALTGELGEAANVAKKLNRIRDGIRGNKETEGELKAKLRSEFTDCYIYLDLLSQAAGFKIGAAVLETFEQKSAQIGYAEGSPK